MHILSSDLSADSGLQSERRHSLAKRTSDNRRKKNGAGERSLWGVFVKGWGLRGWG